MDIAISTLFMPDMVIQYKSLTYVGTFVLTIPSMIIQDD